MALLFIYFLILDDAVRLVLPLKNKKLPPLKQGRELLAIPPWLTE